MIIFHIQILSLSLSLFLSLCFYLSLEKGETRESHLMRAYLPASVEMKKFQVPRPDFKGRLSRPNGLG
jgi:hypothetical protein